MSGASFVCRECFRPTLVADALDAEHADTCTPCSEELLWDERYPNRFGDDDE